MAESGLAVMITRSGVWCSRTEFLTASISSFCCSCPSHWSSPSIKTAWRHCAGGMTVIVDMCTKAGRTTRRSNWSWKLASKTYGSPSATLEISRRARSAIVPSWNAIVGATRERSFRVASEVEKKNLDDLRARRLARVHCIFDFPDPSTPVMQSKRPKSGPWIHASHCLTICSLISGWH